MDLQVIRRGAIYRAQRRRWLCRSRTLDFGCCVEAALGALVGLDERSVVAGNGAFEEFKGAFAEQYVCQQLVSCCGLEPFYWSADNSRGEIDFIVQRDGATYAIEVKAEENLRAKSLRAFKERNHEVNAVRFSMSGVRDQGWMLNVPLYATSNARFWMR